MTLFKIKPLALLVAATAGFVVSMNADTGAVQADGTNIIITAGDIIDTGTAYNYQVLTS